MNSLMNIAKRYRSLLIAAGALVALLAPTVAEAQYQYYAITPCRLYDSRAGMSSALGTGGGAITTTTNNALGLRPLRARGGCGIPNSAVAITVNHTVINPTAPGPTGSLSRLCPLPLEQGQTVCRVWVLYGPSETISNGGILPLGNVTTPGTDNDIQMQGIGANLDGTKGVYTYDWTIDVTGYFE